MVRDIAELAVMQCASEHGRLLVGMGTRTDDGIKWTLLAVCQVGGDWCLHPYGVGRHPHRFVVRGRAACILHLAISSLVWRAESEHELSSSVLVQAPRVSVVMLYDNTANARGKRAARCPRHRHCRGLSRQGMGGVC